MRIGIDLGGTKIEGVALDSDGRIIARERVATPRGDYDATLEAVAALVDRLEAAAGLRGTVGVGTPGVVSPATGLVKNANSTWLNGRPLGEDLVARLGRDVRLANDANCFALSEAIDGAGAGAHVVFGVILGTGVGGGVVVDGCLLAGANAIAGEWGHNPLPCPLDDERPGPPCYCGRQGCIETFLSGPALTHDHVRAGGLAMDAIAIAARAAARAAAREPQATATIDRYAERLARALAGVINLLDPDVIVLGGGLSNLTCLYEMVPQRWGPFVFSDRVDTRLAPAAHGDAGGARGAAWLWDAVPG